MLVMRSSRSGALPGFSFLAISVDLFVLFVEMIDIGTPTPQNDVKSIDFNPNLGPVG